MFRLAGHAGGENRGGLKEEPRKTEERHAAEGSTERSPIRDGSRARGAWWKVLLAGLALYLLALGLLAASARPALVPTVLVLGAFLAPVSLAVFLHERGALAGVPAGILALAFLAGGALGSITAQVLEPVLITPAPGLLAALAAGLGEEAAKLVAIAWLPGRREHGSMLHGILFGAASGAGFAAFESMGYAFNLLQTRGDVVLMGEALLARGALSPLIHGTWTAIVAGILWRERRDGRLRVSMPVVGAFSAWWPCTGCGSGPSAPSRSRSPCPACGSWRGRWRCGSPNCRCRYRPSS